jgi:hypothetical protein
MCCTVLRARPHRFEEVPPGGSVSLEWAYNTNITADTDAPASGPGSGGLEVVAAGVPVSPTTVLFAASAALGTTVTFRVVQVRVLRVGAGGWLGVVCVYARAEP